MTAIGSTGAGSRAPARLGPARAPAPAAQPDDQKAMHHALVRAGGPPDSQPVRHRERGGAAPARQAAEGTPRQDDAPTAHWLAPAERRDRRGNDRSDTSEGEAGATLPASIQPPVTTIAAPEMPAPQVDPAGFARLLTRLWLKERGGGGQEVRIMFGPDAGPATDASITRNAAGQLDVRIRLARQDADAPALGSDLARHLTAAGLAVGALHVVG